MNSTSVFGPHRETRWQKLLNQTNPTSFSVTLVKRMEHLTHVFIAMSGHPSTYYTVIREGTRISMRKLPLNSASWSMKPFQSDWLVRTVRCGNVASREFPAFRSWLTISLPSFDILPILATYLEFPEICIQFISRQFAFSPISISFHLKITIISSIICPIPVLVDVYILSFYRVYQSRPPQSRYLRVLLSWPGFFGLKVSATKSIIHSSELLVSST